MDIFGKPPVQNSIEDFYRRMMKKLVSDGNIFDPFACALAASSIAFGYLFEAGLINEHSPMFQGIEFTDDWLTGKVEHPDALSDMTRQLQQEANKTSNTEVREGLNSIVYLLLAGAQYQQDKKTGRLEIYYPQHFTKMLSNSTESAATVVALIDGMSNAAFVIKWIDTCWEDYEADSPGSRRKYPTS